MEHLQTRNACRHGTLADAVHLQTRTPQTWTARRSVPTSEVIGLGASSGYIPGFCCKLSLTRALPRWGDVSERTNVRGQGTPADTVRRRAGPLGDRSLPRRSSGDTLGSYLVNSSGYIPGSFDKLRLTRPQGSPARRGFLEPRGSGASLSFPVRPSQRRRARPNAPRLRSTRRHGARHDRWGNPRP